MRREDGYTLAELLIVLAIMALAAAAVFPNIARGKRDDMLVAESTLLAALRRAQGQAIGGNRESVVEVDVAGLRVGNEPLPQSVRLKVLFGGTAPQQDVAVFRFFPDGTSTGGEIELTSENAKRRIAVNWLTGSSTPMDVP